MTQSQLVGNILIVEKEGKVYVNSFPIEGKFSEVVKLLNTLADTSYTAGYEIGKKVARRNL